MIQHLVYLMSSAFWSSEWDENIQKDPFEVIVPWFPWTQARFKDFRNLDKVFAVTTFLASWHLSQMLWLVSQFARETLLFLLAMGDFSQTDSEIVHKSANALIETTLWNAMSSHLTFAQAIIGCCSLLSSFWNSRRDPSPEVHFFVRSRVNAQKTDNLDRTNRNPAVLVRTLTVGKI